MAKAVTRQIFGVPSLETARRIDDSDKVEALQAAHYRLSARIRSTSARRSASSPCSTPGARIFFIIPTCIA